jgi:Mn-dependent DtxR family transcriptional regulator
MLKQILDEFRNKKGPMSMEDLSKKMEIDKSTLHGMLEQLVAHGKLVKMTFPTVEDCEREFKAKGLYGNLCVYLSGSENAAYYELASEKK